MAKTINNWCPQGIVHSVQMDCSFRRNDGKNDNRSNRNGTTLLALDCPPQLWTGSDTIRASQICDGKSRLSQPALIMSDPVQVSQICDGKWPAGEIWTGSDTIRVSQICDGKSTLSQPFSVTNLGSPDRV